MHCTVANLGVKTWGCTIETPPNLELGREIRNQVYDELERQADVAASYARSIGEAAFRGDQLTAGVHLRQLRACVLEMIKLYKEGLVGNGQNHTGQEKGAAGGRPAKPAGDGVGVDRSS